MKKLQTFSKNAAFRGDFVVESDIDSRFCGKLENISLNGIVNELCLSVLYVPVKFADYVKDGLCEFTAILNLKLLRGILLFISRLF